MSKDVYFFHFSIICKALHRKEVTLSAEQWLKPCSLSAFSFPVNFKLWLNCCKAMNNKTETQASDKHHLVGKACSYCILAFQVLLFTNFQSDTLNKRENQIVNCSQYSLLSVLMQKRCLKPLWEWVQVMISGLEQPTSTYFCPWMTLQP